MQGLKRVLGGGGLFVTRYEAMGRHMTRVPGIFYIAFGGDGFFLVALTGPGQVWLQSMPLPVLAHALQPYLAQQSAPQSAEAGALGGIIGDIMHGQ